MLITAGFGFTQPSYIVICSWRVAASEQAKVQAAMAHATAVGQVIGYPLFSFWFHDATATGTATALPFTISAGLMMVVGFGAWATACNDSGGCR